MKKIFTLSAFSIFYGMNAMAQCPAGQSNITVDVATDNWGYECFWDITPSGNGCGNGAIGTYGNTLEVNCGSGGTQVATAGGYADNATATETVGCLTIGQCYDINYVDDYGDGGATFTVYADGAQLATFTGEGAGGVFTFCISNHDVSISGNGYEYTKIPLHQAGNIINTASLTSNGIQAVTGASMSVSVVRGGQTVYTATSSPTTINAGQTSNQSVAGYTPDAYGVYTINYTANITETDEVTTNNTFSYTVDVTDSVYARDNGQKFGQIGIGASEDGYLGNSFTVTNAIQLTSLSAMIGNTDGTLTGTDLTIEVFATDGSGMPTSSIASVTTPIVADSNQWYTIPLASPLALTPGKYVVAVKEYAATMQQICWSEAVFTAQSVFASWASQPWDFTENFGFEITFMVRPNLNFGAAVNSLEEIDMTVYPNPATEQIIVSNAKIGSTLQVFNQLGQLMSEKTVNSIAEEVTISDFAPGIYTVKSSDDTSIGVSKFVKK